MRWTQETEASLLMWPQHLQSLLVTSKGSIRLEIGRWASHVRLRWSSSQLLQWLTNLRRSRSAAETTWLVLRTTRMWRWTNSTARTLAASAANYLDKLRIKPRLWTLCLKSASWLIKGGRSFKKVGMRQWWALLPRQCHIREDAILSK